MPPLPFFSVSLCPPPSLHHKEERERERKGGTKKKKKKRAKGKGMRERGGVSPAKVLSPTGQLQRGGRPGRPLREPPGHLPRVVSLVRQRPGPVRAVDEVRVLAVRLVDETQGAEVGGGEGGQSVAIAAAAVVGVGV